MFVGEKNCNKKDSLQLPTAGHAGNAVSCRQHPTRVQKCTSTLCSESVFAHFVPNQTSPWDFPKRRFFASEYAVVHRYTTGWHVGNHWTAYLERASKTFNFLVTTTHPINTNQWFRNPPFANHPTLIVVKVVPFLVRDVS